MKQPDIELVSAESVDDLEKKVLYKAANGWDLYSGIVTSHKFLLGQWMVKVDAYCDYRLVSAKNFRELEISVKSLCAESWDLWQKTEGWNSMMLQWMCRTRTKATEAVVLREMVVEDV